MNKETIIKALNQAKFRTVKAKMIVEAINLGTSERGNHIMVCDPREQGYTISMHYRGTPIVELFVATGEDSISLQANDIPAGEYESTPATIRQRKDFATSAAEIATVVLQCRA